MRLIRRFLCRFPVREEYADNVDHPDPVLLMYLLDKGAASPEIGQADVDSGVAEMVCGGVLTDAEVGAPRRRDESPTRSAQSSGRVNPQAPAGLRGEAQRTTISSFCFCCYKSTYV